MFNPLKANLWIAGILLVLVGFLAYSSVFHAKFIFDDDILITDSTLIQSSGSLSKIWFSTQPVDYFPLTNTVFWIEWRVFGDSPVGYHVVNLMLHLAGSLLLWAVLVRLEIPGAWLAAMLFAVHPAAVSSVAWVSEHKNTLSICFYLLSVLAYLSFLNRQLFAPRRRRYYVLALASFLFALLAKSAVVILPVLLLLIIWWKRKRVTTLDILSLAPFYALSLVMGLITVWFQFHRAMKDMDLPPPESCLSRIAGAGWAVWFYLYKALVPLNLTVVYPKWVINPVAPLAYIPLATLLALFAFLICVSIRYHFSWSRAAFFALASFVITLGPVLGLIGMAFRVHSPVADHFQYFALPALTALLSASVVTLVQRRPALNKLLYSLALILVLTFASLTWIRVQVFQDLETVSRQNIAVNPDAALAWHNLGYALQHQSSAPDSLQTAAAAFNRELKILPGSVEGTIGLVDVLVQSGQPREALTQLDNTLAIKPNAPSLLNKRGNLRLSLKDTDGAIADFQNAIKAAPDYPIPYNNLGIILASKSELSDAIIHYRRAIELDPEFSSAHLNLANALTRTGDFKAATAEYQTALQFNTQSVATHVNFAALLIKQGMPLEAFQHAQTALTLDPECMPARQVMENAKTMLDSISGRKGALRK